MSFELEVKYMGLALEAGMFRPAVIRGYVEKIVDYISAATFLIQYRQNYIKKAYPFNFECLMWMRGADIHLMSRRAAVKGWVL